MNRQQLARWIDEILSPAGFMYRGRVHEWWRVRSHVIDAVALDKSPYGGQFYVDFGASPRELVDSTELREYQLHMRVRLEALVPDESVVAQALDLEDAGMGSETRKQAIQGAVQRFGLRWLDSIGTIAGMQEMSATHPRAVEMLIKRELRAMFESRVRDG